MDGASIDGHDILFIGVGAMGEPMAARIAGAGFALAVSDVDAEHAAAIADRLGAEALVADALQQAASRFRTVVLMLPSSTVVEGVLDGSAGLLASLEAGTVVIDMSSSAPASTNRLAAKAKQAGIDYLDAPVSGGVPRARTGELAIMVGGAAEVLASRRTLLDAMGADVVHVGGHGSGHAMKALNNLLSAVGMVAASEVLSIGTAFGIEPRVALDVLNRATGRNQATEVKFGRYILSRDFDSGFAMRLMVKDLRMALDLAHESGVPSPISASALEEWSAAIAALGQAADHTEIAAYVERRAGVELVERSVETTARPEVDEGQRV